MPENARKWPIFVIECAQNVRKWPIFVIECAQNVRFVLKNVQFACNGARKNARRANNAPNAPDIYAGIIQARKNARRANNA